MVISHNFYLSLALQEAWKYQILTYPNPAVGATLVSPCGKILAVEAHHKAGSAHAEVNAFKQAYKLLTGDDAIEKIEDASEIHRYLLDRHNGCFNGCSMYVTLEPCAHSGKTPACANLIASLGISEVYIGTRDINEKAANGSEILRKGGVRVVTGVLEQECEALLFPFKKFLAGRFVLFKWAQRLDGGTHLGTISSQRSRELVHKIRNVCDLIVIGGNTVRSDKPTLDARLCNGRAPDVLIYSRRDDFDRTIPLFNVPNRRVVVSSSLEAMREYRCILIEGSQTLFELTQDYVDMYMVFISPTMRKSDGFRDIQARFSLYYTQTIDRDDVLLWMRGRE